MLLYKDHELYRDHADSDVTFSRSCNHGKTTKKD